MAQVEFKYNGLNYNIQCHEDQKMIDIIDNFKSKLHLSEKNINYLYDGRNWSEFNKNLTFIQMANSIDKERKMMNIIVLIDETSYDNKKLIKSKNIICPKCGENIKIKINNYKINLFECKNKHRINNIYLNDFEKAQMVDLASIKCDICKEYNKANVYNNEFYKCFICNLNICLLCKSKHDETHNLINYDKIHYKCNKHGNSYDSYTNYCKNCKINICSLCEKAHLNHDKILLSNMIYEKKELLNKLANLKSSITSFNQNINKIIEILNMVKLNVEHIDKLSEHIINNYNTI